jgi:hypothetical protein
MLVPAITVEDQINEQLQRHAFDERLKYYFTSGREQLKLEIRENAWFYLQAASLSEDGEVLGYVSASTDRQNHVVEDLQAIRFPEEFSYVFARDFHEYLRSLFEKWNFSKVAWRSAACNPKTGMYRRMADRYGGGQVGRQKRHRCLPDGRKVDLLLFEVMRAEYERAERDDLQEPEPAGDGLPEDPGDVLTDPSEVHTGSQNATDLSLTQPNHLRWPKVHVR